MKTPREIAIILAGLAAAVLMTCCACTCSTPLFPASGPPAVPKNRPEAPRRQLIGMTEQQVNQLGLGKPGTAMIPIEKLLVGPHVMASDNLIHPTADVKWVMFQDKLGGSHAVWMQPDKDGVYRVIEQTYLEPGAVW